MQRTSRPGLALSSSTVFALALAAFAIVPRAVRTEQAPAAAARPASSSSALPSARSIIDRHIKEIGGREAIMAQTSTHMVGTISMPAAGLTGTMEAFHAKPNKSLQRITLPGIGDLEEGFDGTVGWSLSPLTGPTLLDGKQLQQRSYDADFYEDLKTPDRYVSMTTLEKTTFEGRPAYKIKLVKKNGDEDVEYYDVDTGLRSGVVATRESPMGPMQGTTIATDYKKFGQLLQPTTMKINVMTTQMVMTITSVEYGTVNAAVFVPPAPIKALIK